MNSYRYTFNKIAKCLMKDPGVLICYYLHKEVMTIIGLEVISCGVYVQFFFCHQSSNLSNLCFLIFSFHFIMFTPTHVWKIRCSLWWEHFLAGETRNGLQGITVCVFSESSFLSLGKHCDSLCGFLKRRSYILSVDSFNTTKINNNKKGSCEI